MGFETREMKGSYHWEQSCELCNEWVLEGEEFYANFVPSEIKNKYNIKNFISHKSEWDEFSKGLNDEEIALKLLRHKKPRKKPFTEKQLNEIEIFKKACLAFRFDKFTVSKDKRFIRAKKRGTSFMIEYDIIYKKLGYSTRANEGLFGGLFSNEVVVKISNKMKEIKGETDLDDYSALGTIEKAINETRMEVFRK